MKLRLVSILMIIILIFSGCSTNTINAKTDEEKIKMTSDALVELLGFKNASEMFSDDKYLAGTSIYDWTAMALKQLKVEANYDDYVSRLEQYVNKCYSEKGYLDRSKATEWHRLIIVLTTLGYDPLSFGVNKNGEKINLLSDGVYNYINDDISKQGINGIGYALIAINSGKYKAPEDAKYSEEILIDNLTDYQNEDGGFGLSKGVDSEADITANAILALSWYKDEPKVKETIDKAINYLSSCQMEDGNFLYYGVSTCESLCQVINALSACGIDSSGDERFIKNGISLVDALDEFRMKDGSYIHQKGDKKPNDVATEQALLALISLKKCSDGNLSVYNIK